ncbi:MAG: hypothetical protein AAB262_01300, partial [Elusimicrobiota bacterium]
AAGGSRQSSLPSLAGYLNKLSVEEWQKSSSLIRFTPLTGLACANFFASNQAMRLPKNEYELMEHMTSFHLRHESIKGTSSFSHDTALGLLTKLAWRAYTEGNGGQSYTLPFETVARIMKEHYPHLEEHGSEILSTLGHLPYLEYSPANSAVFMNQHFTDYLVARKVLQTFLAGDSKSLREVMSIPWQYMHMSRYYFQGIRCLDAAQKQRFLHVSRATFQAVWQEYLKDRSFLQAVALAYILQPLGFLDMDEARDFLRQVYTQAEDKGEFVLMSCAIGSAWGEDHGGLEKYVQRMRADGEAAKFNLNVYLFFRRQDRLRLDIENFKPELIAMETKSPVVRMHWKIVDRIKAMLPSTKVVLFGDHISGNPGETLDSSQTDFCITGGDYDFMAVNLLNHITKGEELEGGVYYRKEDKLIKAKPKTTHTLKN